MPYKPKVPCKHPGCGALILSGTKYCDAHKALHPEEGRTVRESNGRGSCDTTPRRPSPCMPERTILHPSQMKT